MRRLILIPASVIFLLPFAARADKFVNTGPGTINTCDSATRMGIGIVSTDSLPGESRLVLGHVPGDMYEGGQLQFNFPPENEYGLAATFDMYLAGAEIPMLRVLTGSNQSTSAEISNWDLATGVFWASGGIQSGGEIASDVGFRANGVALDVPDYVFEPDYKLRDLEETERFVKANRHLPDVPSAATIRRDGMSLTDMNLRLLQKVEELTLYAIEQEKRIRALESRLGGRTY